MCEEQSVLIGQFQDVELFSIAKSRNQFKSTQRTHSTPVGRSDTIVLFRSGIKCQAAFYDKDGEEKKSKNHVHSTGIADAFGIESQSPLPTRILRIGRFNLQRVFMSEGSANSTPTTDDSSAKENDEETRTLNDVFEISEDEKQCKGSFRRLSKRLSRALKRHRSSIIESLPETPVGWSVLLAGLMSSGLGYELRLQKSLTKPPLIFGQLLKGSPMDSIYRKMTATPDSILSRSIQPSLFVGTRGQISSAAAYLLEGPSPNEEHLRFREIFRSSQDGAKFGVDWEVTSIFNVSSKNRKEEILKGPIRQPVVIIMHGINNDASFGYMKSLARTFASRGWNSAAMNFRGCGGVPMTTPRAYNAAYTGDLRNLVLQIAERMDDNVPIFLVGNSLGANLLTKYLGEECYNGSLPESVSGAASLANPLVIHSDHVKFPLNFFLALGVKKSMLHNLAYLKRMKDPTSKAAFRKAIMSATIANLDRALAPTFNRNQPFYPFTSRIGYKSAEAYWLDSSSYRHVPHISVPFLNLTAQDDTLVSVPSKNKLGFCVSNPNVMVVETRCGGHLGWQENHPKTDSAFGTSSWADVAAADFFESIIQVNMETRGSPSGTLRSRGCPNVDNCVKKREVGSDLRSTLKEQTMVSNSTPHSRL